jgi:hypothetical protein
MVCLSGTFKLVVIIVVRLNLVSLHFFTSQILFDLFFLSCNKNKFDSYYSPNMYASNFYQKEIQPEEFLEKVKQLAKEHGLFEIYPFSNSFVEEFVCYEIITFDTRKIKLDEMLKAIVEILSEFETILKAFKKAIPKDSIKFDNYPNDILYVLGGISNRVFSSEVKDYAQYLLGVINDVWMNKLMLDFTKLERLNSTEINYALMVLNEESVSQKNKLKHLHYLLDLTVKRFEFIKESNSQEKKQPKTIELKKQNLRPLFESFLTNISFQTIKECFIEHQICTLEGKFISKIGGRNPFPSPIMIVFLPEILADLSFFDMDSWELINLKEKIEILSETFGVKANPSFLSNAASKNNRPADQKILRFQQLIATSLSKFSLK